MPLTIRFIGGARAGEVVELGDDHEQVTIGRDESKCDVVFPPEETRVGREHCALRRVLGRYRLVLNGRNLVLVGGQPAMDDQEILNHSRLQLGPEGPVIQLDASLNAEYLVTEEQEAIPTKASVMEELRQSAHRGRRATVVTTVVILALVIAGGWLWKSLADQRERLASQGERLQELDELSDDQEAAVQRVVAKYVQPDDDVALGAALRAASDAVYLVTIQNDRGGEQPHGTAWLCEREQGVLATNAHVAELFNGLKDKERMIARNSKGAEVRVKAVRIHPGYRAFTQLWNDYAPGSRTGPASFRAVKAPGPGGDVALLFLDDPRDLPEALPLAPRELLETVDRLTPVGYVGFPMEGMSLVNSKTPTPVSHAAYVIATTDFYGATDAGYEDRHLIHHALPAAGGASGSPILNSEGQVVGVLNAGTVIGVSKAGTRITSGANINFAQRVDLVQELIEGTADANQAARTERWTAAIARHYQPGRELHRETRVQRIVDEWKNLLSLYGDYEVTLEEAVSKTEPAALENESVELRRDFAAEPSQFGLAIGSTGQNNKPVTLSILRGSEALSGLPNRFSNVASTDWVKFLGLPFTNSDEHTAVVTSTAGNAPISLQVYIAKRRRRAPEERIQYGIAEAKTHFEKLRRYRIEARSLIDAQRSLATARGNLFTDSTNVALEAKGDYFFAANSHGDQRIYLEISQANNPPLSSVNNGNSSLAFAASHFSRATNVVVTVIGDVEGQEYDLSVYQIVEKSPAP